MSRTIVIATYNKGKLKEFNSILSGRYDQILSLMDFDNLPEIIEDGLTFEENSYKKAKIISDSLKRDVVADDSGLVVDILNGNPGVRSARYAGDNASDIENNKKLLSAMKDKEDRGATFKCCITFLPFNGEPVYFYGECKGEISNEMRGDGGFGYDPIFYLPQYGKTMAEIPSDLKNKISHRAKALESLLLYFQSN